MTGQTDLPKTGSGSTKTASERLQAFRAHAARASPIKTRSRTKGKGGVLAEKRDARQGNHRAGASKGGLLKTASDPGPRLTAGPSAFAQREASGPAFSLAALPIHEERPLAQSGSPLKRSRSPTDDGQQAKGSPKKAAVAPPISIRSPPRLSVRPSMHAPFASTSKLDDPFGSSREGRLRPGDDVPRTSDGRPLLLRKLSIEDKADEMSDALPTVVVTDSPTRTIPAPSSVPEELSPSQKLIQATHAPLPMDLSPRVRLPARLPLQPAAEITSRSLAPEMHLSGFAAFKASLGLGQSHPLPSSPLSPRRGLARSRSSPALHRELGDKDRQQAIFAPAQPDAASASAPAGQHSLVAPAPLQAPPIIVQPTAMRTLPATTQGLLSAVASRPSYIPRLSVLPATPAAASRSPVFIEPSHPPPTALPAFAGNASISSDMANRLTALESMMSSMGGGNGTRRRHSSVDKATSPPKTPLVGGHHLRRRVSASDAQTANEAALPTKSTSRRSSVGPSNKGSLLPIASTSNALGVLRETSPTKTGAMAVDGETEGPLHDVVAFVDVRTQEGDDSSAIFVEMLRSLGAKVLARVSLNVTHVLWKNGKAGTLARVQTWTGIKPHVVAVGWAVACRERVEHIDEAAFAVDLRNEPVFQAKKRRTMEPRHTQIQRVEPSSGLERQKAALLFHAPKVGSPLKQRAMTMSDSTTRSEDLHSEATIAFGSDIFSSPPTPDMT